MKSPPLNTLLRRLVHVLLLALVLMLVHRPCSVSSDPGPPEAAPEWVNTFSGDAKLHGEPVPVGAVVTAHDPQGVQCGSKEVTVAGQFGVLECRRNDPDTPQDEGPEPGERITFRVNGLPALAVPISFNFTPVDPSTPITWTAIADLWKVRLRAPTPVGGYSLPARWMAISWVRRTALPAVGLAVTAFALAAVLLSRKQR